MAYSKKQLLLMSMFELSEIIKKKKIKCLDVINIFIDNILLLNKDINAIAYDCFEEARFIASEYDSKYFYSKKNYKVPKYFGIPIILKEGMYIKGKPITFGLVERKDKIADYTCNICMTL